MLLVTTPIHEISTRPVAGGVLEVGLAGDFDMSVAAELSDALVRAARAPGVRRVVVDLRHTAFLDSHGIAGLLAGFEAAAQAGRQFSVTNAAGMVRQVLDITGLAEVLIEPRPSGVEV
ncbi:STAS domain-containing protein [Actinoplanes nipponensis]